MRPIRLDLRGFTAFREPQVVDFEGLDLFAITGPTGSGKSSILDAMTFVLYGRAERVGDGVRQLVSQGAPRAVVSLEFETGGLRYRVGRSVTADAKTKILVERADPGSESGWRQYGEGADRVREADAIVARLVGLDYAGFTRAVLLPQGRFAEFLAGDPKTRRRILADLLDLGLFERIATKAGELTRAVAADVTARSGVLEAEYADATEEGLATARNESAEAEASAARLATAREAIGVLVERSRALRRELDDLERLRGEASRNAGTARAIGVTIVGLAGAIEGAARGRADAEAAAVAGGDAVTAAAAALAEAESDWGDAVTLGGRLERARALVADRSVLAEHRTAADVSVEEAARAGAEADTLTTAAAEAGSRERLAAEAERSAAETLETARGADRVAAISAGLAIGDPCPVCGRPIEALPDRHGAPELVTAEAALELARAAAAEASAACRAAERAATEATARRDHQRDLATRATAALADEERRLGALEAAIATELGGTLPDDPVAELERRGSALGMLTADLEARRAQASAADEALRDVDRALDQARAELATERARLEAIPLVDLAARAAAAGVKATAAIAVGGRRGSGGTALAEPLPIPPIDEPTALVDVAGAISERLDDLATACGRTAEERAGAAAGLVSEAVAAIGDLVPPADDLDRLARSVEAAGAAAIGAAAVAASRVADLETRIARRAELEGEIEALRERGARLRQLALELRQDRIVAFLQAEALATLAAAGSVHLEELSSGRYRLEVVDDEFLVVDTWNGEESRSVKTLSGGESFLASLALALALSEQVPSLAASARSRVTSLFLDEGFGTLDEETLQVVIGAVEVLGGDDRMVGVVTHVTDLAERLPARIVVEKSPRGSTIHRV